MLLTAMKCPSGLICECPLQRRHRPTTIEAVTSHTYELIVTPAKATASDQEVRPEVDAYANVLVPPVSGQCATRTRPDGSRGSGPADYIHV